MEIVKLLFNQQSYEYYVYVLNNKEYKISTTIDEIPDMEVSWINGLI